jgi:hypothetical protein
MIRNLATVSAAVVLGLGLTISSASAATCASTTSCTLTFDESQAFSGSSFGTVQLDLVGNKIKITVSVAPDHLIDAGNGHVAFGFNSVLASEAVTVGSFTTASGGATSATYSLTGTSQNSPYGNFDHTIASNCGNGGGCGDTTLMFTVTSTTRGATGFTDVNQLVDATGSTPSALFASDIAMVPCSGDCTGAVGVSTTSTSPVPEPGSYLSLLVGGFGVLGFVARRRKTSDIA